MPIMAGYRPDYSSPAKVASALAKGAKEDDILRYLSRLNPDVDVEATLRGGANKRELIDYMASQTPSPGGAALSSLGKFAGGTARGLYDLTLGLPATAILNTPNPTVEGLTKLAGGAIAQVLPGRQEHPLMSEETLPAVAKFYKERYGSPEAIARTSYLDPFGMAADVSTLALPVRGALTAGATVSRAAGAAGTARKLGEAAKVAGVVEQMSNPLAVAAKAATPIRMAVRRGKEAVGKQFYGASLGLPSNIGPKMRKQIVGTGWSEGLKPRVADIEESTRRINVLSDQAKELIDQGAAQGLVISPQAAAAPLGEVTRTAQGLRATPESLLSFYVEGPKSNISAIERVKREFLGRWTPPQQRPSGLLGPTGQPIIPPRATPIDIPIEAAQQQKQNIYNILGKTSWGELKGAQTEAWKGVAHGLRENIADKLRQAGIGDIDPINLRERDLLNLRDALIAATERGAGRIPGSSIGATLWSGSLAKGVGGTQFGPVAALGVGGSRYLATHPAASSAFGLWLKPKPLGTGRLERILGRGIAASPAVSRIEQIYPELY